MQVQGELKVRELTELLTVQKKTMMELIELQKAGPLTGAQQQMFTAAAAGATQSTAQLNELTRSMRGLMGSQGMMQIGYGLQDIFAAQGGFAQKLNAASNNIQMLAMSMGVGGGWFIAFTALTSALQLAANNWDKINAWIKDLPDPAELKAKADKAKASMAAYEKMKEAPTPLEKRRAAEAGVGIEAYGERKLTGELEAALSAKGVFPTTPEEAALEKEAAFAEKLGAAGDAAQGERATRMRLELQGRRAARVKEEAARLAGQAKGEGPAADAARGRLRQLGLGRALERPEELSPEGLPYDVMAQLGQPEWLQGEFLEAQALQGEKSLEIARERKRRRKAQLEEQAGPHAVLARGRAAAGIKDEFIGQGNAPMPPLERRPVAQIGGREQIVAEMERIQGVMDAAEQAMAQGETISDPVYGGLVRLGHRFDALQRKLEMMNRKFARQGGGVEAEGQYGLGNAMPGTE
jgi:hypothetical protein